MSLDGSLPCFGFRMTFNLLVHGILVPACTVLAFQRVLSPNLWGNIGPLFAISAFGMFLTVDGMQEPLRGLLAVLLYFPLFVVCVYGGAWAQARYGDPATHPGFR